MSHVTMQEDGPRAPLAQGYNCRAVVDGAHPIVVAAAVANASVDNALLAPMVEHVRALGVVPLVAVQRDKHGATPVTTGGPPLDGLSPREQMRWNLQT